MKVVLKIITVEYFDDCFLGKPFRVFFAFDPLRQAVMLCSGDKTRINNFTKPIPIAEQEFLDYLTELERVMAKQLSKLMKKVNPTVTEAARVQADHEIFELSLAQLRQVVEMSQHDLAVALGISQPSVANLEKRGCEVKISSLKRYVEALGCKLSLNVELADGRHIGIKLLEKEAEKMQEVLAK